MGITDFIKIKDRLNICSDKSLKKTAKMLKKQFISKIINPNISQDLSRARMVKVFELNQNGVVTVKDGNLIFDVYDSQLIYQSGSNYAYLRGMETVE